MAKIKNKLAYILALVAPAFSMSLSAQADQPKTAGSDEAAKQGAIEKLVILASLIRSEDNDNNSVWSSIIQDIKISKGELIQSSSDHDFGEQLSSFGGAIALLRWKLE